MRMAPRHHHIAGHDYDAQTSSADAGIGERRRTELDERAVAPPT